MDDDSVNIKVEDTILSSKNFSFNLQPVEFIAVETKIKTEPNSEEEDNVTYGFVPSPSIAEEEELKIKTENVDASSEDLVLPAESMSLCADSSHMDASVIIKKEEDLGISFEETEESNVPDIGFCLPFQNEEDSYCWDKVNATVETNKKTDSVCGNEASSQVSAVSSESAENSSLTDVQQAFIFIKCFKCGSKFLSRQAFETHVRVRHRKGFFVQCSDCGVKLKTQFLLKNHLAVSHGKPFACINCPAAFSRMKELRLHLVSLHSDKLFSGAQRFPTLKDKKLLNMTGRSQKRPTSEGRKSKSHSSSLSAAKPFFCTECPATFKHNWHLKRHLVVHSRAKTYPCHHCSATFNSDQVLQRHMSIHPEFKRKQFSCAHCSAKFQSKGHLEQHSVVHSNERSFSCAHCHATFRNKGGLLNHMISHRNPFSGKQLTQLAHCTMCPATFMNMGHLNQHLMTHSCKEPQFQKRCSQLHRYSSVPFDTDEKPHPPAAHLTVKTNEQADTISENEVGTQVLSVSSSAEAEACSAAVPPASNSETSFQCSDCGLRLKTQPLLKSHLGSSHGKPFLCLYCPAAFSSGKDFKLHLDTHTNDRLFSCGRCSATFKDKEQLLQHTSGHIVGRPFSCKYCSAVLSGWKELRTHVHTHSVEKPFTCEQCSAAFKYRSSLKVHLTTHSSEKPFACVYCPAMFRTSGHLERHTTNVHRYPSAKKRLLCIVPPYSDGTDRTVIKTDER